MDEDEVFCSGMPWHYPFGGSDAVTLDKEACEHFLEQGKPTVFDHITKSPEALAEKVVYLDGIGFTSPFIDDAYFVGKEKDESREERYFKARDKAIAATIAKLNEVIEHE